MHNLAPTALALLKHLGITFHETWELDTWGDPYDCIHVFAPAATVGQVSDFFTSGPQSFPVRIYEGSPPPF